MTPLSVEEVSEKAREMLESLARVVVGYPREQRALLAALLANGHVLLEGVPGIAKTTTVRALARMMGLREDRVHVIDGVPFKGFSRIQFTPDLLPSDVTGSLVFNPATREFEPKLGPVFAYLVLADEINRAVPRTQAALLEAMQERRVTIGGRPFPLEVREKGKFFLVVATQNPVEQEGTYPLPEAQLDRFAVRIIMEYPETLEDEKKAFKLHLGRTREPVEDLGQVAEPGWLVAAQEVVARIEVPEDLLDLAVRLIRCTRPEVCRSASQFFELGASPRAGITLIKVAQAYAAIKGSNEVSERDLEEALFYVLNHRLLPRMEVLVEYEEKLGSRFRARLKLLEDGLKAVREEVGWS